MQKNKTLIGIIAFVVLLLVGGGMYFLSSNTSSQTAIEEDEVAAIEEEEILTLSPEEIGLELSARSDKRAVKFVINNPKDITSVEYEVSYFAKGDIPRGAIGRADSKAGEDTIETKYIDLGSCSSGRCKYDEGVTEVKFTLKITKTDDKVYQVEKSLEL